MKYMLGKSVRSRMNHYELKWRILAPDFVLSSGVVWSRNGEVQSIPTAGAVGT